MLEPDDALYPEYALLTSLEMQLRDTGAGLLDARRVLHTWLTAPGMLPSQKPSGWARVWAKFDVPSNSLIDFRLNKSRNDGDIHLTTDLYLTRAFVSAIDIDQKPEFHAPALLLETLHLLMDCAEIAALGAERPALQWWDKGGIYEPLNAARLRIASETFGPSESLSGLCEALIGLESTSKGITWAEQVEQEILAKSPRAFISLGSEVPNPGFGWEVEIASGVVVSPGRGQWYISITPTNGHAAQVDLWSNRNDKDVPRVKFLSQAAQSFAMSVFNRATQRPILLPSDMQMTVGLAERQNLRNVRLKNAES